MPKYPRGMVKRRGQYFHRDRRGGRDRLFALGSDYEEAKRRFRRLQGFGSSTDRYVTCAEFSERWRAEYVGTRRTEQNRKLAAQRLRDHILPVLGRKLVLEVTAADIRGLRVELEAKGLAALSVRHVLSDVRSMFNYAAEEVGIIEKSPFRRGLMPVIPERGPQGLSEAEVAKVLEVAPRHYQVLLRLELLTGLRYGELRGLRWDAVVLGQRSHLIVRQSHQGPTKSRKVRMVPLVPEAESLLRALPRPSVYVFPGRSGGMMGRNACSLNRIIQRSVPGFTFQRLRHTFATRAREAGLSNDDLRLVLGHSTVKMTEHYARPSDESVRQKMCALELKLPETVNETGNSASEPLAEAAGNR